MANERKFTKELLDELLAGQDPKTVLTSEGVLGDLKKALAERILDAEMDVHLGDEAEQDSGNHRNGRSQKTILTGTEALPLSIPRDRHGRFEPQLIEKYKRRFPGFDEKIIALYARGMSTRDIQAHIREIYGMEISPDLVSAVTDAVHEELNAWQNRPLDAMYTVIWLDALVIKVRDHGVVLADRRVLAVESDLDRECARPLVGTRSDHLRFVVLARRLFGAEPHLDPVAMRAAVQVAQFGGRDPAHHVGDVVEQCIFHGPHRRMGSGLADS